MSTSSEESEGQNLMTWGRWWSISANLLSIPALLRPSPLLWAAVIREASAAITGGAASTGGGASMGG